MSPRAQQARRGAGAAPWKISGRGRGGKRGEGAARSTGRGAATYLGSGHFIAAKSEEYRGGAQMAAKSPRRGAARRSRGTFGAFRAG